MENRERSLDAGLATGMYWRATPFSILIVAGILVFGVFILSTWYAIHQPWIGVFLEGNDRGLRVVDVSADGPGANILNTGDVILTIADQQGNSVDLQSRDLIEDPDCIPTFRERSRFRERQSSLHHILKQPVVILTLEDGRILRVQPQQRRSLNSLAASFWLLGVYGMIALLVSAAIWAVKQQSVPTKFLLLSGFGSLGLLNAVNIISSRELALDGTFHQVLSFLYFLGGDVFAFGMLGFLWHFPRPLGRFPFIQVLILIFVFMLNENLEWVDLPGNSVLIQVPVYLFAAIVILTAQWDKSRDRLVDRVAVKAVILIFGILLATTGFYFTSIIFLEIPVLGLAESLFGIVFIYIGLSLAIVRFQFFDIERWWIEIWLWFFVGAIIVATDISLVMLANMAPPYALGLSVILVAWLYFPVRQLIWRQAFPHARAGIEEYVPLLIRHFLQTEPGGEQREWASILDDVFHPLMIEDTTQSIEEPIIIEDGLRMIIPSPLSGSSVALYYADKGLRLFSGTDVKLVQSLLNISRAAMVQHEEYMQGISKERKRIMRDLHDDVGGKLLSLAHSEQGRPDVATEALKSLREIIYSLDREQQTTLNTMMGRWRIEAHDRCEQAGISFAWRWDEPEKDIELSPRHALNLTLVLREALSNVLVHSDASKTHFEMQLYDGVFYAEINNDGVKPYSEEVNYGKGLFNMSSRVEELLGQFEFDRRGGYFNVRLSIPLVMEASSA